VKACTKQGRITCCQTASGSAATQGGNACAQYGILDDGLQSLCVQCVCWRKSIKLLDAERRAETGLMMHCFPIRLKPIGSGNHTQTVKARSTHVDCSSSDWRMVLLLRDVGLLFGCVQAALAAVLPSHKPVPVQLMQHDFFCHVMCCFAGCGRKA
jgi:hypothetical protein